MARGLKLYKSYSFKEKDPIIDVVRTIVEDSGRTVARISAGSGVSTTAIHGWFGGATKRPQFATVNAVVKTCGKELVPRPIKGK